MGENARQSVRQSVTANVSRFMGESFRLNGFKWRLFGRGRRADSTPGNSRCEEKGLGENGAKPSGRLCHVGVPLGFAICPKHIAVRKCNYRAEMKDVECRAFGRRIVPKCNKSRPEMQQKPGETPRIRPSGVSPGLPSRNVLPCTFPGCAITTPE
jgi:hypothetical protein